MEVVLSTRHGEISERQEAEIRELFERLARYESRISRIEVTLADESDRWELQAHAGIDRADAVHARAEAGDARSAADLAADRMARQLKRQRSRHTDHQAPPTGAGGPA